MKLKHVLQEIKNKKKRINEADTKKGEGFSAVNKGTIKGYEEDAQFGSYDDIEITLTNKLNLGNNYTISHFADALKEAYPEDSDLMSYLGDTSSGDDVTFIYVGNTGKHKDTFAASDLYDHLK